MPIEPDDATLASFPPGARIGRYVVLSMLGAGGMGVVLAAYDPQLDRKVAIKLLRTHEELSLARARLQREAQALAKLDHPNVVTVHDVGVHDERLYLAMEFVAGQTLGAWLRASATVRPWPEVLAVFVEAGRGLAAAHAAGLVHRDFKPDNVMIGEGPSRRVRVMDFGLARTDSEPSEGEPASESVRARVSALGRLDRLTVTGSLLGTPAYMPLEQFESGEADARSDQFGFCVALYEGLYGERPFAANDLAELVVALERDRVREAPASSRVPAWLRRVVVRGLASDPARRWASMQALLDALADDPAPRRRRWLAAGVITTLLAGAAWSVSRQWQADAQVCAGARDKLASAWDEGRRVRVEAAILATGLSYAPDTWARVEAQLDGYAHEWVAARVEACEATQRGEQSGELLDLRMACLDERRTSLAALVDELAQADAKVVERASTAVLALPTLARCSDAEALRASVAAPDDPALAAEVARLHDRLLVARAKRSAGKFEAALGLVDALLVEAEPLGYEPLLARAWLTQGGLLNELGRYDDAIAAFRRALEAALAQRMPDEAGIAAAELVFVVGYQKGDHAAGHEWARLSDALARGSGSSEVRSRHFNTVGVLATAQGRWAEARGHHERALELRIATYGPEHPSVATSLNNLGNVETLAGEFGQASAFMQRALDIQIRTQGPDHPDVASTIHNLGSVAAMQGDLVLARERFEQALAIWGRSLGPDHPDVAHSLANLGALAKDEGRFVEARAYLERALATWERVMGPEHPNVANELDNLGALERAEGNHAKARDDYARALALRERIQGSEHPHLAYSLTGLGRAWLDLGEPERARPLLERALDLRERNEGSAFERGEIRFALAQAFARGSGRDRGRARELAELARTDYMRNGDAAERVAPIDAFLATLDEPEPAPEPAKP